MSTVSLVDVGSYLPQKRLPAETEARNRSGMFQAPGFRHHVTPGETAVDMAERAIAGLVERHGQATIRGVDAILTNTALPDSIIYGCGGELAHRLGADPQWVIDLHNTGCVSFVFLLKLARQLMQARDVRSALVCNVANLAGQIYGQPGTRDTPPAAIPGDGAGVALLTRSAQSPILHIETLINHELAGHMKLECDGTRRYWEPGVGEPRIQFSDAAVTEVVRHGNHIVPEIVRRACRHLDLDTADIDVLVTNQPNRMFLKNWRKSLGLTPKKHPDTFDECGNLFGAGVPVTLDQAIRDGTVVAGSLLMLAGFAHTGDVAAAAAIRWRP